MVKLNPSYNDIHNIVKKLADKVTEFKPDVIIAISGGGLIPARMIRTHIKKPIFTVGFTLYNKEDKMMENITMTQWLDDKILKDYLDKKTVLIIDEVDDTRTTLYHCIKEIKNCVTPKNIIVSVIHNKIKLKKYLLTGDIIYIPGKEIGDQWILYPWDDILPEI